MPAPKRRRKGQSVGVSQGFVDTPSQAGNWQAARNYAQTLKDSTERLIKYLDGEAGDPGVMNQVFIAADATRYHLIRYLAVLEARHEISRFQRRFHAVSSNRS